MMMRILTLTVTLTHKIQCIATLMPDKYIWCLLFIVGRSEKGKEMNKWVSWMFNKKRSREDKEKKIGKKMFVEIEHNNTCHAKEGFSIQSVLMKLAPLLGQLSTSGCAQHGQGITTPFFPPPQIPSMLPSGQPHQHFSKCICRCFGTQGPWWVIIGFLTLTFLLFQGMLRGKFGFQSVCTHLSLLFFQQHAGPVVHKCPYHGSFPFVQ